MSAAPLDPSWTSPAGFATSGPSSRPRERRELEASLRNQYEEYYDEQREEWHTDLLYTPEEANREANAYHRYRLFTFSNFLTTLDTLSTFQENIEDILADAHAGSVLLMIGAKGGRYPAIQNQVAKLADACRFHDAVTMWSPSPAPTRISITDLTRKFAGSTTV